MRHWGIPEIDVGKYLCATIQVSILAIRIRQIPDLTTSLNCITSKVKGLVKSTVIEPRIKEC